MFSLRPLILSVVLLSASCATVPKPLPDFQMHGFDINAASSVRVDVARHGHASGTIIRQRTCLILTSEHIMRHVKIADETMVTVTLQNAYGVDEVRGAKLLFKDPTRDIALVWTPQCGGRGYKATLASDEEAAATSLVYSIGFPGSRVRESAKGRIRKIPFSVDMRPAEPANFKDGILADMTASGGSSGSGVYSATSGNLIGIHKMSFRDEDADRSVIVSVKEIRWLLKEYDFKL